MSENNQAAPRFWLIVHKPGNVPERKGSWPITEQTRVLREFMKARPDSYLHIVTIAPDGAPEVQHGPEALQMADQRSLGTGRKHNARTLAAHEQRYVDQFVVTVSQLPHSGDDGFVQADDPDDAQADLDSLIAQARDLRSTTPARNTSQIGQG